MSIERPAYSKRQYEICKDVWKTVHRGLADLQPTTEVKVTEDTIEILLISRHFKGVFPLKRIKLLLGRIQKLLPERYLTDYTIIVRPFTGSEWRERKDRE